MAQEDLQTVIDKQNVKIRTIAAAHPELHLFLSNLPELDTLVTIDVGSEKPIVGKIVVSRDFGLIIDADNGYYYLVHMNAIKSILFHPKNEEIQKIKDAQTTPVPLTFAGATKKR
jgi:hypothetical protein